MLSPAALEAPESEALSFGTVRATKAQGQEYLLQAVALILGRHYRNTKADVAARQSLLGPILKQNEAIRQYLRVRRASRTSIPRRGRSIRLRRWSRRTWSRATRREAP